MSRRFLSPLLLVLAACAPFPDRVFTADPRHDFDGDGLTEEEGDCDDARMDVGPGAPERCDGADNDCDGTADNAPVDPGTWYRDADADDHGDEAVAVVACAPPSGFVSEGGDCDDTRSLVHADAVETCAPFDEDCDGATDDIDPAAPVPVWYVDRDGDAFGDPAVPSAPSCEAPAGFVYDATDCDDADPDVHPRALELCNAVDDDCDGRVDDADDDATGRSNWYRDADADGFGSADDALASCDALPGRTRNGDDCDDSDPGRAPGAIEQCDGVDQDCDGRVDDGVTTAFYADLDADGFGDGGGTRVDACSEPPGFSVDASDCDDARDDVSPGAPERCDGVDNDCNGLSDEGTARDALTWHADADSDGYGDPDSSLRACSAPLGHVADATDCDDSAPGVYPGAREDCATAADDDCDGDTNDADALGCSAYYVDADADDYGLGSPACICRPDATRARTARVDGDCDDTRARVQPGARETCATVYDDDCDGDTNDVGASTCDVYYTDVDGDGAGDTTTDGLCLCEGEGYETAIVAGDCDDLDARILPGAAEYCDGIDQDCDRRADEDAVDATPWYEDGDGDGYGSSAVTITACDAPDGFVADATDCEDGRAGVHPGAAETCATRYDDDCDAETNDPGASGCTDYFQDSDDDGYGTSMSLCLCREEDDWTSRRDDDCDDAAAATNPGTGELCSTPEDDDCDGVVNGPDAEGCTVYILDADADGYGAGDSACLCAPSAAYNATRSGDCDDTDPAVNPGAANCGIAGPLTASDAAAVVSGSYADLVGLDYNGDGFGDAAFAYADFDARGTGSDRQGGVWVYFGPLPARLPLDGTPGPDLELVGATTTSYTGAGLEAGDFDGDGTDELIFSDRFGGTTIGLRVDARAISSGSSAPRTVGTVLTNVPSSGVNVGDVNGDGRDDLVSGSIVYLGTTTGFTTSTALDSAVYDCILGVYDIFYYPDNCQPAAREVSERGGRIRTGVDWNGDGLSDIVTNAGVYLGAVAGPAATVGVNWTSAPFAWSASAAESYGVTIPLRDWNDDGYADAAMGYTSLAGSVRIYVGGLGASSAATATFTGDETFEGVGDALLSAGDLDGDGRSDLWVAGGGTPDWSLWYGGTSGTTVTTGHAAAHVTPAGTLRGAPLGDTDGDGYADLVLGTWLLRGAGR